MRREGERTGARVGVVCPGCIIQAIDQGSNRYLLDFSWGEQLVETTMEKPRWRIVLIGAKEGDG